MGPLLALLVGAVGPSYTYRETQLDVEIPHELRESSIEIAWRRIDRFGRASGKWTKTQREPSERTAIEVDASGGHEVRLGKHRIWATRGTWYALPRKNAVSLGHKPTPEGRALGSTRDITLAGAFSVKVDEVQERGYLEIGRTLGMDLGAAILPPADAALVVVGGGTQQGVIITLTERRAKEVAYWDYALNLEKTARRYVIPLEWFAARSGTGSMKRIEAIAIRSVRPADKGDILFVDRLALLESPPRLSRLTRGRNGISVVIRGKLAKEARLMLTGEGVKSAVAVFEKKLTVSTPEAKQSTAVSLCYRDEEVEACDPPDAPIMTHAIPDSVPLLIDDFAGAIPVNALRLRTEVYTSTIGLDPTLVSVRKPGSILLHDIEKHGLAYAGYRSPLPPISKQLSQLAITVRGDADPTRVKIGLRDLRGDEPKVSLDAYATKLDPAQPVRIPLSAFAMKRKPIAVTVTLEAGSRPQRLEITRIELIPP